jgi:glycosyltransferase involved in cell wall biosynthesis
MKPFKLYDQWRYRRWETRVFRQASELVAVTRQDADVLRLQTGKPVAVVVNGVDTGYYAGVQPDLHAQRLLFIGNYEYSPNLDAVEWALEEILPALWKLNPGVRFAIAGFGLPDAWRERWSDPRIEWQGFVPDLRALQSRASIFFAPLRQGGGSKLKVLEAMAAGLPVVTTDQGSSGLKVENGRHYLGSGKPSPGTNTRRRLGHPSRLHQIAEAGRATSGRTRLGRGCRAARSGLHRLIAFAHSLPPNSGKFR